MMAWTNIDSSPGKFMNWLKAGMQMQFTLFKSEIHCTMDLAYSSEKLGNNSKPKAIKTQFCCCTLWEGGRRRMTFHLKLELNSIKLF